MKKVLMVVLDGFGVSDNTKGNAVKDAKMVHFEELWEHYPHMTLEASGPFVGLEEGQFGNSEVGHMTMGAGRVVKQSISIIREFLKDGYKDNVMFDDMIEKIQSGKPLHVMGLLSDGKVHSSLDHFLALLDVLKNYDVKDVYFHVISDGRDTDTKALYTFISKLEEKIKETGIGHIASICGRYYAMDRDKNWNRTKLYYDLVTNGKGYMASGGIPIFLSKCYEQGITDEFMIPIKTEYFRPIVDGDALLWMNYRTDRAKQIISTFVTKGFSEFPVSNMEELDVYSFLPIDKNIKTRNFTERDVINNPLGVYLSKLGLTQARIAETEKYAHVTYFFDGESNASLENCQKILIPSPKVATYDLKPEMSAVEITKKCVSCLEKDYDFILMNFANADMVGHTGKYEATVNACITIDMCLKVLKEKCDENFYTLIITADHGNADCMIDEKGHEVTTHTSSLVPFIITDKKVKLKSKGDLTGIAPTILKYMDIAIPKEMQDTKVLLDEDAN